MVRRSVMTLFSDSSYYSHQVRIVLAEKGVSVDVLNIDTNHPSGDLAEVNPYNTLPTLVDRELVLYEPRVIMEYLDERFPHPPLLPVYPIARAKSRLMMHRIQDDWYRLVHLLEEEHSEEVRAKLRQELTEGLTALAPVFGDMKYFLSDDFSLVDCTIAPLLWRLPSLGIHLTSPKAKQVLAYAENVFNRDSFEVSLTESERELRLPGDV